KLALWLEDTVPSFSSVSKTLVVRAAVKPQRKTNMEKEATATVKQENLTPKKDQNKLTCDDYYKGKTRSRKQVH
uniref:Uncharacterized protein n=1 Tax=Falco tinnunculus TaxID=100819 RepID=A0A8C4TZD4_FALTI